MFKKLTYGTGIVLSFLSVGTLASAGSLAEGLADPEVEELVLSEDDDAAIGLLPIVGLLVVGAVILSVGGGGSSSSAQGDPRLPKQD